MPRLILALIAAGSLAFCAFAAGAKDKEKEKDEPKVELVKFVDFKDGKKPVLKFTKIGSTKTSDLPLEPDAKEDLVDTLKELKGGEYVKIEITLKETRQFVTAAEVYEAAPGEEEENVYVYVETEAPDYEKGKPIKPVLLKVTKLGKEFSFALPSVNRDGRIIAKDEYRALLVDLSEGDPIEVLTSGAGKNPTVKTLRRYEAPKIGTFVKVTETGDDPKTKTSAVILKDEDEKEQTVSLPAAKKAALLTRIQSLKLKEGDLIQYRTTTDDKGAWLLEIKNAPKDATTKKSEPKDKDEEGDEPATKKHDEKKDKKDEEKKDDKKDQAE